MRQYIIEAAAFKIPIPLGGFFDKVARFSHNFWILKEITPDGDEKMIAQLHGLATDRNTNEILPIGYASNHCLRAYHCVYDKDFAEENSFFLGPFVTRQRERRIYMLPPDATEVIYSGEDALKHWLQAATIVDEINKLDLSYPPFGFLGTTVNSNAIYHTYADVMELRCYKFPNYHQVGLNESVFPQVKNWMEAE